MQIIDVINRIDAVRTEIARLAWASEDPVEIAVYGLAFYKLEEERFRLDRWCSVPDYVGMPEDFELMHKIRGHFDMARHKLLHETNRELTDE